ncbi:unnamed protein product, partial [Soboliphyme baturini]|uniref:MFS domain-containing protein n=1 Tax=Soboliphyme baturini TaxID=241478 RepID=A0A183IIL5_9BILA
KPPFPWRAALTSIPLWATFIAHWAGDWAAYAMLTSMPTFMNDVLKISQSSLGLLSSLPYVAYFCGTNISGFLADFLQSRKYLEAAMTRKLMTAIAYGGQGTFLVAAGLCSEGQVTLVTTFLTLGMGLSGFQYSGVLINYMDIAPQFSGTLFGIGNTMSSMAGILAPAVMGAMTPNGTKEEWLLFFNLTDRILTVSFVLFLIFGKGEVLPWARDCAKQQKENSKVHDYSLKTLKDGAVFKGTQSETAEA